MAQLSPSLSLWVLIPVPFVASPCDISGRPFIALRKHSGGAWRAFHQCPGKSIRHACDPRLRAGKAEIRALRRANRDYVNQNIKLISAWSMFLPALTALIGLTFVLVLWFGGRQVIEGQISARRLHRVLRFHDSADLSDDRDRLRDQYFSARRRLHGTPELHSHRNLRSTMRCRRLRRQATARQRRGRSARFDGEIDFRHLIYYPRRVRALDRRVQQAVGGGRAATNGDARRERPSCTISTCTFPAGSTLAIVGPTGSGKSTLAALIARLWEAPPDTLFIDGRSIREWPLEQLRRCHRLRAAGYVSLQRNRSREHRLRRDSSG